MGAKMNYLETRNNVISQNIANADTPQYRPRDLTEVDFGSVLKELTGSKKVRLDTTNPGHMPQPNSIEQTRNQKQKLTYEVAPDGNAVIVEEQMVKATQVNMDYSMLTNLMRKQAGMIRTALGRS
jgi:flagellar basal-body rod protein FlgB